MAMTKAQQLQLERLENDNERLSRKVKSLLERINTLARSLEILSDRCKLTDEQRDDLQREAEQE